MGRHLRAQPNDYGESSDGHRHSLRSPEEFRPLSRSGHRRAGSGAKDGSETVVILSATLFHGLKQAQRRSMAAAERSDADIATAEIPASAQYSLKNLG